MFKTLVVKSTTVIGRKAVIQPTRGFFGIFSDADQASGRRKEEIEGAKQGYSVFNRDPIVPQADAGTLENPILVPSGMKHRAVGWEDPVTHCMHWFNLHENTIAHFPILGLHFKLQKVGDEESH